MPLISGLPYDTPKFTSVWTLAFHLVDTVTIIWRPGAQDLYKKLADGHATKFIADRPDLSVVTDWLNSPRSSAAVSAFRNSVPSKKPGRVIERISKHVRPAFGPVGQSHEGRFRCQIGISP